MRRRYVAIEGIDGAGKTLMTRLLEQRLKGQGVDVIAVKEPWGRENTRFLYEAGPSPLAEAIIFAADRLVLQHSIVKPALEEGAIVLSDRSVYSSLAYQYVRGLPEEKILELNSDAVFPGTVILLDIEAEEALARLGARARTRFEKLGFLERVRRRYLELAGRYGFHVVDAARSPPEVLEELLGIVEVIVE